MEMGPVGASSEEPVFFPAASRELFGILTRPLGEPRGVGVLILSGGGRAGAAGTPHPGRNRVAVRVARRMAGLGYHALRIDYRGVGESGGDPQRPRLADPYVDDVEGALHHLQAQGVNRTVILGACFGGRAGLATAARTPAVSGLALVGSPVRDFERGDRIVTKPVSWFLARAVRPKAWAGLLDRSTRASYSRILRRRLLATVRRWTARRPRGPAGDSATGREPVPSRISHRLLSQLATVVGRGVPVLFVFGTDDEDYDDFKRGLDGELGGLVDRAAGLVTLEEMPGTAHGLTTVAAQDETVRIFEGWLDRVAPTITGAPPTEPAPVAAATRRPPSGSPGARTPVAVLVDEQRGVRSSIWFEGDHGKGVFVAEQAPVKASPVAGVVVCPAIWTDFLRSYRREVVIGRQLAAGGLATLRFHYRFTGNSDGGDQLTLPGMVDDAAAMSALLQGRHNVEQLAYVGTRLGALPAMAAAVRTGAGAVVLVEPVVSADRYLREGFRARRSQQTRAGTDLPETTAELVERLRGGTAVELLGHTLDPGLYRTLAGESLAAAAAGFTGELLVIQLSWDDRPRRELEETVRELSSRGVTAELAIVAGREAWWFLEDADLQGDGLFECVTGWLGSRFSALHGD